MTKQTTVYTYFERPGKFYWLEVDYDNGTFAQGTERNAQGHHSNATYKASETREALGIMIMSVVNNGFDETDNLVW